MAERPEIALVYVPTPAPFDVFVVKFMVGLGLTLQHTPFEIIALLPSLLIFPPLIAEVEVIEEMAVVAMTGKPAASEFPLEPEFVEQAKKINANSKRVILFIFLTLNWFKLFFNWLFFPNVIFFFHQHK